MGGGSPIVIETLAQADALQACLERPATGTTSSRSSSPCATGRRARGRRPRRRCANFCTRRGRPHPVLSAIFDHHHGSRRSLSGGEHYHGTVPGDLLLVHQPGADRSPCVRGLSSTWRGGRQTLEGQAVVLGPRLAGDKYPNSGDPYRWQIERTCAAIAARLGSRAGTGRLCFQSRVGPMKWIGPSTPEAIDAGREGRRRAC